MTQLRAGMLAAAMAKFKKDRKSKESSSGTSRADKVLSTLGPEWPTLTSAQCAVFAARYSDFKCEQTGGRTKSEGVLGDAIGWAPIMAKALSAHSQALRRYSPERFSWFLQCARALADARAAQQAKGKTSAVLKAQAEKAERAALTARADLLETLEELADGNDAEEQALAAAVGSTDKPDSIVTSIGNLVKLARDWLNRTDHASKLFVKTAGLTLAEVEEAENAAQQLAAAGADKTMGGRSVPRDAPAVNRIEGRLLLEMKAAMRVFNRANARNKEIAKLVPGDATRSVLVSRGGKAQKTAATETPAPVAESTP